MASRSYSDSFLRRVGASCAHQQLLQFRLAKQSGCRAQKILDNRPLSMTDDEPVRTVRAECDQFRTHEIRSRHEKVEHRIHRGSRKLRTRASLPAAASCCTLSVCQSCAAVARFETLIELR